MGGELIAAVRVYQRALAPPDRWARLASRDACRVTRQPGQPPPEPRPRRVRHPERFDVSMQHVLLLPRPRGILKPGAWEPSVPEKGISQ